MKLCLIGAGGHAKVVADAAISMGHNVVAYSDPRRAEWLDAIWLKDDSDVASLPSDVGIAIGCGAMTTESLRTRFMSFNVLNVQRAMPAIVHMRSIVASGAVLGDGVQVLAGAIINCGARVGPLAIINTGSIIEHDVLVGEGAHIAPGAIILGGATVGAYAMIGAGAVVLPGTDIAPETLVRAASLAQTGS